MLDRGIQSRWIIGACAAVVMAALVGAACESQGMSPYGPVERDGTPVTVGSGTAYAYVVNGSNGPASVGVALSQAALAGLPATDTMWTLPLPAGVTVPPFDHVMINWNAQGHPPGPYMLPHFDVHFYTITPATQAAIPGGSDTLTVPSSYVPRDYVSTVESAPDMGVHWIDTTSAELHGHPFDRTFVYGFSRGTLAFLEPMVTRAFLASQPSVSDTIRQPQAFAQAGRYPARYRVYADARTNTVRVELDSLTAR